jgi:hypothetical protein
MCETAGLLEATADFDDEGQRLALLSHGRTRAPQLWWPDG